MLLRSQILGIHFQHGIQPLSCDWSHEYHVMQLATLIILVRKFRNAG